MGAVRVSGSIHWVGVIDWNLRDFHGYETPRGSTYNAYVVQGADKTAVVDTVKKGFVPEMLARLVEVVDPASVDLIVVNHVEPDHNSGLREVMEACPNARVVASKAGVQGVAEYHDGLVVEEVDEGDVIDLGGMTLRFMPMPMVHWPDSMFTYCAEECVLMPNDAFGQHLASSARFADEVGMPLALRELGIYYANILMPLSKQVGKAVDKVVQAGWTCKVIAPSHGVIWRGDDVGTAIGHYRRWTSGTTVEKVVLAYGTMWGSTAMLASAISDGVAEEGVQCDVYDLSVTPIATVTADLLEARALVLGSSTLHHGMLYRVAGYLQWLAGLRPAGKLGGVFGSFGWGGGAVKAVSDKMGEIGFELPFQPVQVRYRPTAEDLDNARDWGRVLARQVKGARLEAQAETTATP